MRLRIFLRGSLVTKQTTILHTHFVGLHLPWKWNRRRPIYADFRPIPGKTYIAEKYECHRAPTGYVVSVNGHRVNVRNDECKEV